MTDGKETNYYIILIVQEPNDEGPDYQNTRKNRKGNFGKEYCPQIRPACTNTE